MHVGHHVHMLLFVSCAAFATHATCPKPEPPRQAQPPCSRRCELPGPLCGSRQMKHVLLPASPSDGSEAADAAVAAAIVEQREEVDTAVPRYSDAPGLESEVSLASTQ